MAARRSDRLELAVTMMMAHLGKIETEGHHAASN
jgi:hypothetical protein